MLDYEIEEERERFFAAIGRCVTLYQAIEDELEAVFVAALGGDEARARAVFSVVRGLKAKLEIVERLLQARRDPHLAADWDGLARRLVAAAKARNQIAHARPATGEEARSLELRKARHDAEAAVWTTGRMAAEHDRWRGLLAEVRAFAQALLD